ncbi:hypothetical protein G5V58_17125 [Nocardioides anomalus]|uniref:WD40 repeat domain-containing protein n=1 Tax=Nocardioides anomalus TaxID=2712223 RepID=A0A6G6WGP9_9ACTN|nr:hypothetical protein [Nocardioides anomalus]QIG44265.1 hypothetical protein G5V58_17125 [Nocardioides anomalus]
MPTPILTRLTSPSTLVHLVSVSALAVAAVVVGTAEDAHGATAEPTTAAAAAPGTLVYVKDFNVWAARTDGTDARRITSDGSVAHPYLSPSQADTGAVVVAHDERIVRMDAFGHVLTVLDPPGLLNSAGHLMDGTPSSVAISPNGALVAYTQVESGCPVGVDCDTRFATGYTAADHLTDPAPYGVTYGNDPSWLGNDRTVQGGGAIPDVRVHVLGQPSPPRWFADSQIENPGQELTDPTVSRNGTWVSAVRDTGPNTSVLWAKADGDLVNAPELWCSTSPEPVAEPAFSADSTTLAWVVGTQGIYMERDLENCAQPALVVPGGREPSFSAAPFSTVDPYQPPKANAPRSTGAPSVAGKARVGKRLSARTGTWTDAASYAFTWLRGGKAIKGAKGSTYKLGRKDAGKKIAVRVTATGPGGSASATSKAVKVKR